MTPSNSGVFEETSSEFTPTASGLWLDRAHERGGDHSEFLAFHFITRIARALNAHGAPAHRLEEALTACATRLHTSAQFFSTPTSLIVAFGSEARQEVHMIRTEPGGVDLGRLVELDELMYSFSREPQELARAHARLDAILSAPPRYSEFTTALATGVAAAGAAVFFHGKIYDVATSFALGMLTHWIGNWTGRRESTRHVFEPIACFVAAALATIASRYWLPISDEVSTSAALIVLLPGLSLTVAMTELATRHLVSGTARLAGVLTIFLTMTFGVALARQLCFATLPPATIPLLAAPQALPDWATWLAVAISPGAFLILFRARRQDAWAIFATSIAGFIAATITGTSLGRELGAFSGALVVGLGGNFYARYAGKPSSVAILSGLLLLVPGSVGFRSLGFFMVNNVNQGIEAGFQMMIVASCLVGGLLTANVFAPPRRAL